MRPIVSPTLHFFALMAGLPVAATIFSPLAPEAFAIPPRAERVANRIAERRYARATIAEARAAQAQARVAEIAPAVPVPPPPRPATVRRMARAGVPLGGQTPPAVAAGPSRQPPRSLAARQPAAQPRAGSPATAAPATAAVPATPPAEPGAWTLDPEQGVSPAAAELAPDGTRSVLAAGGDPSPRPPTATAAPSVPAVTHPPAELLPTPEAK
ncbi:MAG: hypothetical protein ACKO1M_00960 [Planctomycetota bacterium]